MGELRCPEGHKGPFCVLEDRVLVKEGPVKRWMLEILKSRVAFVPDDVWDRVGSQRGEAEHHAEQDDGSAR